eukprot:CAMPEP_0198493942 /NCGR_PEP_ID=MMETSP1462-20131121/4337_1 /TAXON_ID=1333877 /ORGANISM="Brandtodinium nutriculum, Strain RCC3387" /LENGTH=43 /DNA_ID= /DNA_START= /DNA_END= /DNA_ORIENTATION=
MTVSTLIADLANAGRQAAPADCTSEVVGIGIMARIAGPPVRLE